MVLQDPQKIERVVLSTVIMHDIVADEAETKRNFKLDEKYFSLPFHKDLVKIITYFQKKDIPFDENVTAEYLKHYNKFDEVAFLDVIATVELPLHGLQSYYKMLQRHYESFEVLRIAV